MASNKELIKKALELAALLEIGIETEGLNNAKLSELVADLKAKSRDAELQTQADGPIAEAEAEGPKLADGKTITSKRGILVGGAPISPRDLAGGEEAFQELFEKGYIVE